ncbi:ParB N-terminal domain-containing protein [Dehalococcoides mccartyi]|uniref:ParB N-terminal domain-containing protein n=1 Tax=Dehalococcoides mccartyi TaxID=61435 RepID=UPI00339B2419
MITDSLKPLAVPIDSVIPDPKNARKHPDRNLSVIKKSLELYGQRKPIIVNKLTGYIEAGNATWCSAKALGWKEIAAIFVEDAPDKAEAYGLMDNRSAELAEWELPILKDILQDLDTGAGNLEDLTGFSDKELEDLINQSHIPEEEAVCGDTVPICNEGDLWQLGSHRLSCGVSVNECDVIIKQWEKYTGSKAVKIQ